MRNVQDGTGLTESADANQCDAVDKRPLETQTIGKVQEEPLLVQQGQDRTKWRALRAFGTTIIT